MTDPTAILCLDIDGTLIDANEKAHPDDIHRLQNLPPGLLLMITTGRILHSAKGVFRENGFPFTNPIPFPGVFMNGGVAYLPGEELHQHHTFKSQTRHKLALLSQAHPRSAFMFFAVDTVFMVNPTPFGEHIADLHHLAARPTRSEDLPDEIVKLMILDDHQTEIANIAEQAQEIPAEQAFSLPFAYEVNPPGVNKAASLIKLLKSMRHDGLPIYVAGDAENDLALFQLAHTSFAPTTAHPMVIERADHLIPRAEEGLLKPILTFIEQS